MPSHVEPLSQRVNRGGFFGVGDLHQAQFGPIGVFAHEFGVNGDEFALRQTLAQIGQSIGSGDQIMYFHCVLFFVFERSAALGPWGPEM